MTYTFELPRYRRFKVWLDEVPAVKYDSLSTITRETSPNAYIVAGHTLAAVEISIAHGAKSSYALLGAKLSASDSTGLRLAVGTGTSAFFHTSSIFAMPRIIKVGLPHEYAVPALRGLEKVVCSIGGPTRATMHLHWAAYSDVESSASVFEHAGQLLARIMIEPTASDTAKLGEMFEEMI